MCSYLGNFNGTKAKQLSYWKGQDFKTSIMHSCAGLPDFSWYNIPKRVKIYQITTKYTKWLQN
jgi:hypothetical protein